MFNGKAIILLLLSIAIGGGAAVFAQRWLQEQQGAQVVEGVPSVDVVVATREIPYGHPIEASHLRTVSWPQDVAPPDALSDADALVGKLVNQAVLPGEPLLGGRVVEKLEGSRLSALISPNMRAITVRVNDVAGVAGFLLPGNRVDVLATRVANNRAATRTLLQNIKVLAIDQKANPDKDDPIVVRAVTLEATLDEAGELAGATSEGTIQLVLRNPEDNAVRVEEVPVAAAPAPRKPRDTSGDVTIIRGTSVDRTRVRL